MTTINKNTHLIFWKINNGFILMPKYDHREGVEDNEVYAFKDLNEMHYWLDKFYKKKEATK